VPDNLMGKKVKCPSCATIFTAATEENLPTAPLDEEEAPRPARRQAAPPPEEEFEEEPPRPRRRAAPPPEEEEDEEPPPRRRSRRTEEEYQEESETEGQEEELEEEEAPRRRSREPGGRGGWQKVRTGITLLLAAIGVAVLGFLVYVIGGVVVAGATAFGGAPAAATGAVTGLVVVVAIFAIFLLSALGLSLAGYVFCTNAPPKHNAQQLARTTLFLAIASLVLVLVQFGLMFAGALGGILAILMQLVSLVTNFSTSLTFLFFLRAVARCLRNYTLERSVQTLIYIFGATIGCYVLLVVLIPVLGVSGAMAAQQAGPQGAPNAAAGLGAGMIVVGACGCLAALLGLTAGIWYLVALFQTRAALSSYLARR
jgi:hypothetical protein